MSLSTIISEYSSSMKSAPLMTRRGSSSCPLVKKASARATRSGERGAEPRRHLVPGERRDALDLRPGGDRHDAGDERQRDARAPGALDEAEVVRVVVEELRDHHLEACVDLHLEVLDAALAVAALRMPLGMPAPDQAEVVAALADEADHVERVAKAVRRRAEAGILRTVAADRDHVLDTAPDEELAVRRDLVPARLDAGHVRRALEAERADARHQLDRRLARLRPGAGHGDEPRAQRPERVDRAHEGVLARGGGGREELEGDDGAALGVALADLHGRLGGRREAGYFVPFFSSAFTFWYFR